MPAPQNLRVFISSPGDVAEERDLARALLKDYLPYRPLLRDQVTFNVVSWDDPAQPTPMPATLTPQVAVNRGRPKPSECKFVVVILWSRLGTPLPSECRKPSGESYLSGTEWEFWDAYNAPSKPTILVYHRKGAPAVPLDDPAYEEKRRQYDLVRQFLASFTNPDGSIRISVTPYETPSGFKDRLASDLEELIARDLKLLPLGHEEGPSGSHLKPPIQRPPSWEGSPYPGLRPFKVTEADIFFGRDHETAALVAKLRDPNRRFLAVVGASGNGKSSLVRAGLLPRLQQGAIEGSTAWPVVLFNPGYNPFSALASALESLVPQGTFGEPNLHEALANTPADIIKYADQALTKAPTSARLCLFWTCPGFVEG